MYNEIAGMKNLTLEEKIKMVEDVTIEDVKEASKLITLDTIYFLKGDQNEEN